jgi:hypothetical protein
MTTKNGGGSGRVDPRCGESLPGIVIAGGHRGPEERDPRISAFIWGGKVRPTPTLPYGRRKGAA